MGKKILLITNYFPPETGAAANRMYSLAEGLGNAGFKVKVVCPLPNYPTGKIFKSYSGKILVSENDCFGIIKRLWIWPSNSSNKFVRLLSMLSFSFSLVLFLTFNKTPKKVFIQYSPVFVGFTGVFLCRLLSKKIILNVSDLWPLAGLELGVFKKGIYHSLLLKMERFCYKNADLIIGQSEEILRHINKKEENYFLLYRNFPNFQVPVLKQRDSLEEIRIVYAGLLGVAQGVYEICKRITLSENVSLHIYGAGPEAEKLNVLEKQNIYFYGELHREDLHIELQNYDIAFIPLIKRIYGSVPSKIYEYTRLGLPVLYFAGGEGGDIVEKESLGWVVPVNDFTALQDFINTISISKLDQFPKAIVQRNSVRAFDFTKQFDAFTKAIELI